ncbi:MAG: universal stress protein [Bacteroidales bacterium]
MEEQNKSIVVPWDFTPVAEFALAHAAKIARMVRNDICLLHIVDSSVKTRVEVEKKTLLNRVADEGSRKYNTRISAYVVKGSIFTTIADFVNNMEASLVVMGTHGMQGMQKLTGSWALKVIVKSKIPFIVVQSPPVDMERYHNIVFPVDFRLENKEKMGMAIFMGKYFDSKVHILKQKTTDKSLLRLVNVNLNFAIKYLTQNNIQYQIHEIPRGSLAKQTLNFAHRINADLIMTMTTRNISLADYVFGAAEQYIIANSSKIPVCCVNPKASFAKVGQFMYG